MLVDAGAPNYQQLINDLLKAQAEGRRIEVVVLETGRDGIEQISEAMAERRDVDAVHIISHGSDENLQLGNAKLNAYNLESYRDAIKSWQVAMIEGGDRANPGGQPDAAGLRDRPELHPAGAGDRFRRSGLE